MKETFLPPEHTPYTVACPTMNRWGEGKEGEVGVMGNFTKSAVTQLLQAGWEDQSRLLIADASKGTHATELRAHNFRQVVPAGRQTPSIYVMTPEMQAQVAEEVSRQTGIARHIIAACLTETGYASQRAKIDFVGRGGVASFDDDTYFPGTYPLVEPSVESGFQSVPNSFLIGHDHQILSMDHEQVHNSLVSFFEHLGKTVGELRKSRPGLRATEWESDTMNTALQQARAAQMAQFAVTHSGGPDITNADNARVLAVTGTKHGIPDYRTVQIARFYLQEHFPDWEVPVRAIPSGKPELFAFQRSDTNVDSAAFARMMDEKTSQIPWWFVSSDHISRQNPLQTVTGHYRADNELLPHLMGVLSRPDQQYVIASGLDTQVYHDRARSGYRPNMHEQSTASLVGNVAATEAINLLRIDPDTMQSTFGEVSDHYEVPVEKARSVFDQMKALADICELKMNEIAGGKAGQVAQAVMDQYRSVFDSIKSKLADFDFAAFHKHMNTEVRDQLRFFAQILGAQEQLNEVVQGLIKKGRYPVETFVPRNATTVPMNGNSPGAMSGIHTLGGHPHELQSTLAMAQQ